MRGTQSGAVICATSTSPSASFAASAMLVSTLALPDATPGDAARPCRIGSPDPDSVTGSNVSSSASFVVTGRDCSIQTTPSGSKAHSVSWGAP